MTLVFITEARYTKNKDQNIYYENSSFAYQLWENYLEVFDRVVVVARVQYDENHDESKAFIASGDRVKFIELPYFIGAKDYLLNFSKLRNKLSKIIDIEHASYLCRVPGNIGHTAIKILKKNNKNYGVEVVGDPWDVFSSIEHPLKNIIRRLSYNRLKYDVANASASLFVTEQYLQKRYKPSVDSYTTSVSDVIINEEDFLSPSLRASKQSDDMFRIISVGSLEQMYKSPNILLKSIKEVIDKGFLVHLNWLGDGVYKEDMIKLANELGIEDYVTFSGNVGKAEVKKNLEYADLFVLISQTEGLPRAMIEAMASSLPCIGTRVGGIPELITEDCLVDVNDIHQTSNLIIKFITEKDFRKQQSEINFIKSQNFERKKMAEKRLLFLKQLKKN